MHYPFLINTILPNYPFSGAPMVTIRWQMYMYYALRNLCGIFMRAISVFLLTVLLAPLTLKAEEQIYLILMTNKGEAHSPFPIKDTPHCEEDGKKWMSTAIKEARGNLKSYNCALVIV